jgi:hypothetical protein
MRKRILLALSAIVVVGFLGSASRVDATRTRVLRFSNGDHDIYQACSEQTVSVPSEDGFLSDTSRHLPPDPAEARVSDAEVVALFLWLTCLGNVLSR